MWGLHSRCLEAQAAAFKCGRARALLGVYALGGLKLGGLESVSADFASCRTLTCLALHVGDFGSQQYLATYSWVYNLRDYTLAGLSRRLPTSDLVNRSPVGGFAFRESTSLRVESLGS